jgi:hypothetical protein
VALIVFDGLDMLVTCDPTVELDGALTQAITRLRAARAAGESHTARRLLAWIDYRLDERCQFAYQASAETTVAGDTVPAGTPRAHG